MTNFPDRDLDRSEYPPFVVGNAPIWIVVVVAAVAFVGLLFSVGGLIGGRLLADRGAIQQTTQPGAPGAQGIVKRL